MTASAAPPALDPDHPMGDRVEALFKEYAPAWLALARECCGDGHHAEDAVVEALSALNRAFLNGGVENPAAWMATAIRRRVASRMRKEATQHNLRAVLLESPSTPASAPAPPLPLDAGDSEAPGGVADEPFVIEPEHYEQVKDALPRLPERQREVIRLRLFEKLSPKDIAKRLRCTEDAVRNAQHHAVKNLQRIINKEDSQ